MLKISLASLLTLVCCAVPALAQDKDFDYSETLGIVYQGSQKEVYLATDSNHHRAGTAVKVVAMGFGDKQKLLDFSITGHPISNAKVNRVILREHRLPFIYPLAAGRSDSLQSGQIGLGIIGSKVKFIQKGNTVVADLDLDNGLEYFRTCASSHGLHVTVWTGQPLQGKLRWHGYYVLGYEAEPNCTEKDYW